jgi:hypothetical protein
MKTGNSARLASRIAACATDMGGNSPGKGPMVREMQLGK